MQYNRNKYIINCLFILVILQVMFAAPYPSTGHAAESSADIAIGKMMDKLPTEDNQKRNNKQIRKSRKSERRAAKDIIRAAKMADKAERKALRRERRMPRKKMTTKPMSPIQDSVAPQQNNLQQLDSIKIENVTANDTLKLQSQKEEAIIIDTTLTKNMIDSIAGMSLDSLLTKPDSIATDSVAPRKRAKYIDEIIHSTNADSMVFDVKNNLMYLYKDANVNYAKNTLKSYYMKFFLDKNEIFAKGTIDDSLKYTKVNFNDGGVGYDMDSINYNLRTQKAVTQGIFFKEGEGFIHGEKVKMMNNKTLNLKNLRYTTCDDPLCPHFYLASRKAQIIQGKNSKNIVLGLSNLVIEGVSLPIGVPFAYFPLMSERSSGIIIPDFGEESQKGFFLRGGGYYFAFNDYLDITIRGGIYTLGSWEANAVTNYKKLYKYNGNVNLSYSKDVIGEKGMDDYMNTNNYRISWSHSQDPKFLPNSTFSASVNYSTSSFNKYNGNLDDYITAQTNSSISYSKTWAGKPFSLSANLQHSQNNRDSTVSLTVPNISFNVSKLYPFKHRISRGRQKWYEKIGMTYSGSFNNSVTTKQDQLFKKEMFDNMKYGINHDIPVNASFTAFKYLNLTPGVSYKERWYFNRIEKSWDPSKQQVVVSDTTQGFYRVYNYSASFSLQTILYGMYTFKGDKGISAIRHVMTPSVSFSYAPDFSNYRYGFYKPIQIDSDGKMGSYSPYEQGIYGVPGKGESGTLSFSLSNTLEMKVRSKTDTTGFKKIKLLESLNLSSSYNLLADSMQLAPVSISARTTLFKTLGINASATWDPYKYNTQGIRTKEYGLGRINSISVSFGYSFRSVFGHSGEGSGTGSETLARNLTPEEQRDNIGNPNPNNAVSLLLPEYYNFSIPWNLSLNYIMSYSRSGLNKNVNQTVSYNGSITITPKWGFSFSGGLNLQTFEFTPGSVSIDRDLHCWQMGFTWVPVGFRKSWSFNIKVKSSILQDLKLTKRSGYLDNLY